MTRAALRILLTLAPATGRAAAEGVPPGRIDNRAGPRALFVRCWTVPKGTEGSLIAFHRLPAPLTPRFEALLGETPIHLSYVNGPRIKARNLGAAMAILSDGAQREAE